MQKMMEGYLSLVCNDIALLANDQDSQAEIVDLDLPQSRTLLKERIAKSPSKPIIVISLYEVASSEVIYVKKPLVVSVFIHALLTAKKMVDGKQTSQSEQLKDKSPVILRTSGQSAKYKPEQKSRKKTSSRSSTKRKRRSRRYKIAREATKLLSEMSAVEEITELQPHKNQRETVRYIFEGIEGYIKVKTLIGHNDHAINVLDISSKGACIHCTTDLKTQLKLILIINLSDHPEFKINARIIRKNKKKSCYGLVFDKHYHDLIDLLFETALPYKMI